MSALPSKADMDIGQLFDSFLSYGHQTGRSQMSIQFPKAGIEAGRQAPDLLRGTFSRFGLYQMPGTSRHRTCAA